MTTDCLRNVLLFVATQTEAEQLEAVAGELGLEFRSETHPQAGEYREIQDDGSFRAVVVRTAIGALGYKGSAHQGIYYRSAFPAHPIIQLGMAFGIDPTKQAIGDVLISGSLVPYDFRTAVSHEGGYRVDYSRLQRRPADGALVALFEQAIAPLRTRGNFEVHVGAILSGGVVVRSTEFKHELIGLLPPAEEPIVGGEMEAVGLLSVSPPETPAWIVVKGISDFGEKKRPRHFDRDRLRACRNAAWFVLNALASAEPARDDFE